MSFTTKSSLPLADSTSHVARRLRRPPRCPGGGSRRDVLRPLLRSIGNVRRPSASAAAPAMIQRDFMMLVLIVTRCVS